MHTIVRLTFAIGLAVAAVLLLAPAEAATLLHTYVSSTGSTEGSCDITAPCPTFSSAYSNTAAGGEITCVDSGNYGSVVTISHSITINCENVLGSITEAGGAAIGEIIITAGASDVVILKGLDLDGLDDNAQTPLINFGGAGVLHVEKVKINRMATHGIFFGPNGSATLDVSDSTITDNGSGTTAGIYVQPDSGVTANVTINRTAINNNIFGIVADGTKGGIIKGTITDSVVSGNSQNGITASSSGSSVVLQVDRSTVASNGNHGLVAGGSGAGMLVSNTNVFNNGGGLYTTGGGTLYSYGNNHVNGNNGNDGTFTGTVGQQ
jgi:Right handed beta helix region